MCGGYRRTSIAQSTDPTIRLNGDQLAKLETKRRRELEPVRFTDTDAAILYTIPYPPVDIGDIVGTYTFINRCAPPSYDELAGCLSRAFNAGILHSVDGKIAVMDEWYKIIHAADETTDNEIESMIEFEDWLIAREFPAISGFGFCLDQGEYQALLRSSE